jgi:hypothetical protein
MIRRVFLYIYMLRVPILVLLVLGVVLPMAFGSPMFRGLADLETNQIIGVSFGAFLLFSAAMSCSFLVLLYGGERADGNRISGASALPASGLQERPPISGWIVGALYLIGGFLYLRFLQAVFHAMKAAHTDPRGLTLSFAGRSAAGALIAVGVALTVFLLDLWISPPRDVPQAEVFGFPILYLFRNFTPVRNILTKLSSSRPGQHWIGWLIAPWKRFTLLLVGVLGPGYGRFNSRGTPEEINPGHEFAGLLELVCIGLYLMAGLGGHRRLYTDMPFYSPRAWDAVLLQVVLLLLLACWSLSGVSFFSDRFRIPVLIPVALFLFATSQWGSSDHAFHTFERGGNAEVRLRTPEASLLAAPEHVIAVAAAGGGIQAAAWTSQVLCGLRADIGPEFDRSVLVVSAVSGGSVGTMFYLRCRESPEGDMTAASAATNSSLEAIAWGLAHPDLMHAVFPIQNMFWAGDDRGWALERALRKNVQFKPADRALGDGKANQWPIVIFNSTEVRTGDPIAFTNSEFPSDVPVGGQSHMLRNFHHVYAGRDVNLETAVRMSAAFPYVSPAARADEPPAAEHLADGGYFDNSGIFVLGEWLKAATANGPFNGQHPPKNILIVQIDAFPEEQQKDPADAPKSWAYQLIAPIFTVLHVRSEGQTVRDAAESVDLIQVMRSRGYDGKSVVARYSPNPGGAADGASTRGCPSDPPLTWRLTELDKTCIQKSWNYMKGNLEAEVRKFLASRAKQPAFPYPTGKLSTVEVQKGLYVTDSAKQ